MASHSNASSSAFVAEYTAKDLILYALAIGFGSSEKHERDELKFIYENHVHFSAVETFPLILPFWANRTRGTSQGIQPFPPPMLKSMGILPKKFLRADMPPDLPVIQTSQSIKWYRPLPVPRIRNNGNSPVDESIKANLVARTISIVPKSIGTFVTAETDIACNGSLICTLLSTNLVLGMSPDDVIPYEPAVTRKQYRIPSKLRNVAPVFEWRYQTIPAQALLYRIASGDSNVIHVDASAVPLRGDEASTQPLLHGLCTLGIAVRAIMQYLTSFSCTFSLTQLDLQFTKPVFVGDRLVVHIWDDTINKEAVVTTQKALSFIVLNYETGDIVVDHGLVMVNQSRESNVQAQARL
jgi:acyl dehydratase